MQLEKNFDKLIFFKVPTYLFVFLPFFLITGPFLSDLALTFISLIFLIYCISKKDFSYLKNRYFYFFLIFWIYLNINSLFNFIDFTSLKISLSYLRFGIFAVAVYALLNFDSRFLKNFFYCLLLCFLVLIIDGFIQYFYDKNLFGWPKFHPYRVSSFFGDELILGSYISRFFPILFGLGFLFYFEKKIKFSFIIAIFVLAEILTFVSGERAAFFYINLSALFIILFSKNLKLIRLFALFVSFVIIIFISIFSKTAKERIVDKTFEQIMPSKNNLKKQETNKNQIYIFSEQHTHHYISAYRMFADNKIIGVGIKNFRHLCDKEKYNVSKLSCSTHPHNTYIQFLSETGILGFGFMLFVLVYFIKYLLIHTKSIFKKSYFFNDFEICLLSGIAITLWPFIPTGNFFNNWLCIIYYINLPVILWSLKRLS